jgi:hypothetical protein
MKFLGPYALPATAARRLLEIASGMDVARRTSTAPA